MQGRRKVASRAPCRRRGKGTRTSLNMQAEGWRGEQEKALRRRLAPWERWPSVRVVRVAEHARLRWKGRPGPLPHASERAFAGTECPCGEHAGQRAEMAGRVGAHPGEQSDGGESALSIKGKRGVVSSLDTFALLRAAGAQNGAVLGARPAMRSSHADSHLLSTLAGPRDSPLRSTAAPKSRA